MEQAGEGMTISTIKVTWRKGAYYVSIPEWDGGEVVRLEDHEREVAELKELLRSWVAAAVDEMRYSPEFCELCKRTEEVLGVKP